MIPITLLTVSAHLFVTLAARTPFPSLFFSLYAYNVCCMLLWSVRMFLCQLEKQDFEI